MALDNAALLEVLEAMQGAGVEDRVRAAAETIYQALIDAEFTAFLGADRWERTEERVGQRNGTRARTLSTTAGDLVLGSGRSARASRSSLRCWSGVGGSIRRCSRW